MSSAGEGTWYNASTHANAEPKAARNLLRQGFEADLPLDLKRRSHARKIEKLPAPLFPRYLFGRIHMASQPWLSINSAIGLARPVSDGACPAPVPIRAINVLKAREDEGGNIKLNRAPSSLPGKRLQSLAAALADNLGRLELLTGKDVGRSCSIHRGARSVCQKTPS